MLDMPVCPSRREVHQDGDVEVPRPGGAVWRGSCGGWKFRRADSVRQRLSHAKPVSNRHPMNAIDLGNANALPREKLVELTRPAVT
jgi:hypothetical protein